MKSRIALLTLLAASQAFGAYSYYVVDAPASLGNALLYANPTAYPGSTNFYQTNMTLTLAASGGTYVTYLHASSNAVTGPSPQGSFYAIEVQNVTLSGASGTGTLVINRANNGSIRPQRHGGQVRHHPRPAHHCLRGRRIRGRPRR